MTTFFPGHVYRHAEKWPAFETVDEDTGEKDADGNPIFKKVLKPLTNVLTHHFLLPGPTQPASPSTEEIAAAGGSVYSSEFSIKWGINVTTEPGKCTDGPEVTVHGKMFVGDGDNSATYEANAPHLYVKGKVGIGDGSPFTPGSSIFSADSPHLYVVGATKIVGATMIEDPIDVADPAKLPPVVNPLFHVKGFTKIEAPSPPPPNVNWPQNVTPSETNPLLHIAGQTVITGADKVADPTITPFKLRVVGDTVLEGKTTVVGPLIVRGGDLSVESVTDNKGVVTGGNLTVDGTTTLDGPLVANKGATITGDLTVKGNTTVEGGNLEIKKDTSGKGGDLKVEDDASVGGDLTVKGKIRGGGINKRIAAGALAGAAIAVAVIKAGQGDDNDDEPPSSGAGSTALNPSIDNPTAPGPPQKPMLSIEGHGEFVGMLSAGGRTEPVRVRIGELLQNERVPAKTKKAQQEEVQTKNKGPRKHRYGVEINWFDEFVRLELLARNKYNRDAVLVWGNDRFSRFVLRFNCDDKPPMSYDGQSSFAEKPSPDHRIRRPEPEMANDKPSELRGSRKLPPPRESKRDHVRDIMVVHPTGLIEVNGWVRARGYRQYSDMHMKDEIQPIASALTKVQALRGVRYVWADDEPTERDGEDGPHLGLIAQEVEQVLPEAVATDADEKKSVDYLQLTPLLIEAVKEQQTILDAQKRQIEALEQKIQQLMGLLEQKPQGG